MAAAGGVGIALGPITHTVADRQVTDWMPQLLAMVLLLLTEVQLLHQQVILVWLLLAMLLELLLQLLSLLVLKSLRLL